MKRREWLVASAILLTVSACERADVPTAATIEVGEPSLAAGPSGRFRSFRVPTDASDPRHITLGPDGAMWFTESNLDVSQIGRIDADGNVTEFAVPTQFSQPSDIVTGPDGALWFTAPSGWPDFFIGRVTTEGVFTGFTPCESFGSCVAPMSITAGPEGSIWFTDHISNAIWKVTPEGVFTSYPIPTPAGNPAGITVGADGALWFAEFHGNKIGRFDPLTDTFTEYGPTIGPSRVAAHPNGTLWWTSPFENKIGRLTLTPGVPPGFQITEFPIASPSQPRDIVVGPDGNLWFTEFNAERLSQITTDGVITEVKSVRGGPWGIGRGLGNDLWIAQMTGNRVARFTLRQ